MCSSSSSPLLLFVHCIVKTIRSLSFDSRLHIFRFTERRALNKVDGEQKYSNNCLVFIVLYYSFLATPHIDCTTHIVSSLSHCVCVCLFFRCYRDAECTMRCTRLDSAIYKMHIADTTITWTTLDTESRLQPKLGTYIISNRNFVFWHVCRWRARSLFVVWRTREYYLHPLGLSVNKSFIYPNDEL